MARWKCEEATMEGAEAIMNALEADGFRVVSTQVIKSRGMAPIAGGTAGGGRGGVLLGEYITFRVFITARRDGE